MTLALALLAVCLGLVPAGATAGVVRERLPNGLTVIVRENPVAPVVAVSLMVRAGTRWERPDNAGITNFLHAVMVKGTVRRGGAELANAIAALGGKLSATGDVDHSEIRASALSRFWRELLGITAEVALTPKLAPGEIGPERDWLLSRIQRRRDNAPARAFDELYAAVYGPHPYALSVLGTPASLARVDHAALVVAYRAAYQPHRMVLSVSGQVVASEVMAEATRLFGGLPKGPATADPALPVPVPTGRRLRVEMPVQQTQILVGGLAPALTDPDHAAVKVLSTVLGGGMAGRLFAELRDRRGLAYSATSYYDPVGGPGVLVLYLGTAPENATRAEAALRDEIERIRREPVTAEELQRAKGYLLGRYAMDRRTNERLAWYLAFYELEGTGADFPDRFRKAVEAVTTEDVLRAARRYLDTPTSVVLGPR